MIQPQGLCRSLCLTPTPLEADPKLDSRPTASSPLSRNVKDFLTVFEGALTNLDRTKICIMRTSLARSLHTSVHVQKEILEETNRMNRNGKAVRFYQAFNPATRENSERHHSFFGNELRLIKDLAMAREVQQQLLQREVRNISGIDLATACVPALASRHPTGRRLCDTCQFGHPVSPSAEERRR